MKLLTLIGCLLFLFGVEAAAQPRPLESGSKPSTVKAAPQSFPAKYEGGMFGFPDKETGSLKFDDENKRLVFFGKDGKELFGIPFESLLVVSPQSNSVTSTTGNVVSHIPLPGAGLASLIKEKRRYLVLQFNDPDADVRGVVNFKLENRELLESAVDTLGKKAGLTQRGDSYYRPKEKSDAR